MGQQKKIWDVFEDNSRNEGIESIEGRNVKKGVTLCVDQANSDFDVFNVKFQK